MHEPSDSGLLWDAVRVMTRLLEEANAWGRAELGWRDHRRAAKKRARDNVLGSEISIAEQPPPPPRRPRALTSAPYARRCWAGPDRS
jgi:hypothetical protein